MIRGALGSSQLPSGAYDITVEAPGFRRFAQKGDTSNTQINGSQNRSKEILLDGVGSVSPESGGGFEVYATKSGTNSLHRGVYIGGPVLLPKMYNGRSRTFFHFVWSGFRFRKGHAQRRLQRGGPGDLRTRTGRSTTRPWARGRSIVTRTT